MNVEDGLEREDSARSELSTWFLTVSMCMRQTIAMHHTASLWVMAFLGWKVD